MRVIITRGQEQVVIEFGDEVEPEPEIVMVDGVLVPGSGEHHPLGFHIPLHGVGDVVEDGSVDPGV